MNVEMRYQSTDDVLNVLPKEDIILSIIIPVYNNVNFTKAAVQDLLMLPKDHEIIIVDNDSSDNTQQMLSELAAQRDPERAHLVNIRCPRNLGFGRANNKGYKHSRGRHILFLNNDVRVQDRKSNWTEEIIRLSEDGWLMSANGGLLDSKFNFIKETNDIEDSEYFYLSGWCMAASRETFDRLILNHISHDETDEIQEHRAWGPWNEKFFAYFEDDDLTWRARDLEIPLKVIKVPVIHFGQMTSKKLDMSTMYKKSQVIFRELWASKMKG